MYEIYIITAYAITTALGIILTTYSYAKYRASEKRLKNLKKMKNEK